MTTTAPISLVTTFESTVDSLVKDGWNETQETGLQKTVVFPLVESSSKSASSSQDKSVERVSRKEEIARKAAALRQKAEEAATSSRTTEDSNGEDNNEENALSTEWAQQVAKRVEEATLKLEKLEREKRERKSKRLHG